MITGFDVAEDLIWICTNAEVPFAGMTQAAQAALLSHADGPRLLLEAIDTCGLAAANFDVGQAVLGG